MLPDPSGIFPQAHSKAPIRPIPGWALRGGRDQTASFRSTGGRASRKSAPNMRESYNSTYRDPAAFSSSVRGREGS